MECKEIRMSAVLVVALVCSCVAVAESQRPEWKKPIQHSSGNPHWIHFPTDDQEPPSGGITRHYYISVVDVNWDFAPLGNIVNDDPHADERLPNGPDRIGKVYAKTIFRRFTDHTFSVGVPQPEWMGILGPIIRAEVGDTIMVHLKNMAFISGRNYSIHPHGVQYDKDAEGALYLDNTSGADKVDDGIPPGEVYIYKWLVRGDNFAPTDDDNNCLPWPYHSHVISETDIATGLVGMLFTCKKGILTKDGERNDVGLEYIFYMDYFDENVSWLAEENVKRCGNVTACSELLASKDDDFVESNKMSSINGRSYGNLPGVAFFAYEQVTIHLFSLYTGVKNMYISGIPLTIRNHRLNCISWLVGSSLTVEMFPVNTGAFLMSSHVTTNYVRGTSAYVHVFPGRFVDNRLSHLNPPSWLHLYDRSALLQPATRTYYLAAEKVIWDYAPSGENKFFGGNLTDPDNQGATFFKKADDRIGGKYVKAVFVEYTDGSFTRRKPRSPEQHHLAILGPVIRGNVGDTVRVVFRNNADREYSFWPTGLTMTKENEGLVYKDAYTGQFTGKTAQPGETVEYTFQLPAPATAPTDADPDCVVQTYQSAVDHVKDLNTGLVGPILVCKKGYSRTWNTKKRGLHSKRHLPAFREFFILFLNFNENESWYLDENIYKFAGNPSSVDKKNRDFLLSNIMFAANGRVFGNLEGLVMYQGDDVVWYGMGLGAVLDFHVINFMGSTFEKYGNTEVTAMLRPGTGSTFNSKPREIGKWAVICRPHVNLGMAALYSVLPRGLGGRQFFSRRVRVYYIAAVEVDWEYCDKKVEPTSGKPFTSPDQPGYKFCTLSGDKFIGSIYKKAVYREFTDRTFTRQKARRPDEEHLHLLGPFIRGEVGETIIVVFKNLASKNFSVHGQGVAYDKTNEGSQYADGPYASNDDSVGPGQVYVYKWDIPVESGPGPSDPNCISWMYFSQADFRRDVPSGLIGPLVVCRPGVLDRYNRRQDVDKEFALFANVFVEANSWYFDENVARFAPNRVDDAEFAISNLYFSINGKIYFNAVGFVMNNMDLVSWHVMGWGGPRDTHPIHFHGQTLILSSGTKTRIDVVEVGPALSETVEMLADNPGRWIVHCHKASHIEEGMSTTFTVLPSRKG
ncbi:LOW QUALITY PROTEIN: ferroxidase HEPHL1-like [Gigantopelta aegis]|uniref:LOW QUALITY PROTEIN: ferroxidase HEPHL1-like n=1 Tax=Gigantopelta aegis TaxID=1735272 RepID=UPI001B88AB3F|nr:LOW QUALITY PROTEIN: ferroxidase HEPHL1-like [Gigantopelta aegis]